MKKIFINVLLVIISCLCIISFASCDKGIKRDEAQALINEFFAAIVAEDYDKAEELLHPELSDDLESFLLDIEKDENLDFQAGITIERYTGFSTALYDSNVGGSTYELTMRTKVGDDKVIFTIEIVKNENGYGIYNLDIDT